MTVYVVNAVCDEEYGNTEVVAVFSTMEKAEAYVKENQSTWRAWWDSENKNTLTIAEWEVE